MQRTIKCLVVDDAPEAHYILTKYINSVECLELQGHCYSSTEAVTFLHEHIVDLLFLEIQMPLLNGFELLKMINPPPAVIITTGHAKYALESYQYGIVDYLLKPVELSRFLKAMDRFMTIYAKTTKPTPSLQDAPRTVLLKVNRQMIELPLSEIQYAQSLGNYVKLVTHKKNYICSVTTAELEIRLPANNFMRIHKSYIVSLEKIEQYRFNTVIIRSKEMPVGITYRKRLEERLRSHNFSANPA